MMNNVWCGIESFYKGVSVDMIVIKDTVIPVESKVALIIRHIYQVNLFAFIATVVLYIFLAF